MVAPTEAPPLPDTHVARHSAAHADAVSVSVGWSALLRFWWLAVAIAVLAVGAQFARSTGSTTRFEANTTVYLGAPLGPAGLQINTVSSQAVTGMEIATGDEAVRTAAKDSGMSEATLRAGLAVRPVQSPVASKSANPPQLVKVTVRGTSRTEVQRASESIAASVVDETNAFAGDKVASLEKAADAYDKAVAEQRAQRTKAMAAIAKQPSGDAAAIWSMALSTLTTGTHLNEAEAETARSQAITAKELETSRVVTKPSAHKVGAASRSRGLLAAAVIGLILGCAVALVAGWFTGPRSR
jgi:hypothetical protein